MLKRSPLKRYTRINPRRSKPRTHKLVVRLTGKALTQLRNDCFWRDGGICQECGQRVYAMAHHSAPNSYHMAHRQNKRMYGDTLENVRALCGDCHRAEHGNPLPKRSSGVEA